MKSKNDTVMIQDFHTHSFLSDGALLPSELVRRYSVKGFNAVAITDHADLSNIDFILTGLVKVCRELNKYWPIFAIPGVELTHLPTQQFKKLVVYARKKGAKVVVGHGESPVEPVVEGTNRAAIMAGVDILAHPGKITLNDAKLARKRGVFLEITTRMGHKTGNSHVAKIAKKAGASLIFSSDSHMPCDIPDKKLFMRAGSMAGLSASEINAVFMNSRALLKRVRRA